MGFITALNLLDWDERDYYDKNEQESYVAYFMIGISLKFTEDPILACIVDTFIMT